MTSLDRLRDRLEFAGLVVLGLVVVVVGRGAARLATACGRCGAWVARELAWRS